MGIKDRYTSGTQENPRWGAILRDAQPVSVRLTVRYSISPDKVSEVYEKYSHNGDLSSYVQTATHEIFKAVTAKYSAPDLIAERAKVSTDIYAALGSKLAVYGAQVINIDMRNFSFQESYMRAINSKVEQEQLRLAADRWNGQLPQNVYAGAPIPFLNVSKP